MMISLMNQGQRAIPVQDDHRVGTKITNSASYGFMAAEAITAKLKSKIGKQSWGMLWNHVGSRVPNCIRCLNTVVGYTCGETISMNPQRMNMKPMRRHNDAVRHCDFNSSHDRYDLYDLRRLYGNGNGNGWQTAKERAATKCNKTKKQRKRMKTPRT